MMPTMKPCFNPRYIAAASCIVIGLLLANAVVEAISKGMYAVGYTSYLASIAAFVFAISLYERFRGEAG
jgi:hypothetical protein